MPPTDWEPAQYAKFAEQRAQPFWDLFALVEPPTGRPFTRMADLGCGTGELTVAASRRLGDVPTVGIDSSPEMLTVAATHATATVRFEHGDIAAWTSAGDHDVVLANASLHWVPDHPAVLARWVAALRPGGQLAVQVPAIADHPSHRASVAVAGTEPFHSALGGDPPPDPITANVLRPEEYVEVLHSLGIDAPHVRLQMYPHLLPSTRAVVDWTRGTSLTRFFARLPAELHEPFVDAYRAELLRRIGDTSPYLYVYQRILIRAQTAG